jgi:hypothetical protein
MTKTEYQAAVQHFEQAIRKYTATAIDNEPTMQLYRAYVIEVFGSDPITTIKGRCSNVVGEAKHCLRAMLKFNTKFMLSEIATLTKAASHSTISCSLRAHYNLMLTDRAYNAKVMEVQMKIDKYEFRK